MRVRACRVPTTWELLLVPLLLPLPLVHINMIRARVRVTYTIHSHPYAGGRAHAKLVEVTVPRAQTLAIEGYENVRTRCWAHDGFAHQMMSSHHQTPFCCLAVVSFAAAVGYRHHFDVRSTFLLRFFYVMFLFCSSAAYFLSMNMCTMPVLECQRGKPVVVLLSLRGINR